MTIVVLKQLRRIKSKFWFKILRKLADPLTTRALTILMIKPMSLDEMMKQKALNESAQVEQEKKKEEEQKIDQAEDFNRRNPADIQLAVDGSLNQSRDKLVVKHKDPIDPMLNFNSRKRRNRNYQLDASIIAKLGEEHSPHKPPRRSRNLGEKYSENPVSLPINLLLNPPADVNNSNTGQRFQQKSRIKISDPDPNAKSDRKSEELRRNSPRKSQRSPTNDRKGEESREVSPRRSQRGSTNDRRVEESKRISPERSQRILTNDRKGEESKRNSPERSERSPKPRQNNFVLDAIDKKPMDNPIKTIPREPEQSYRVKFTERGNLLSKNSSDEKAAPTGLVGADLRKIKMEVSRKGKTKRYNI